MKLPCYKDFGMTPLYICFAKKGGFFSAAIDAFNSLMDDDDDDNDDDETPRRRSTPPPPPVSAAMPPVPPSPHGGSNLNAPAAHAVGSDELLLKTAQEEYKSNLNDFPTPMRGLVDAAMADGAISDIEMRVLSKKASDYQLDPDELTMRLQALLVLRQRVLQLQGQMQMHSAAHHAAAIPPATPQPSRPATPQPHMQPGNTAGAQVDKCPNCGQRIQSGQTYCPDCGFAFAHIGVNSSAQRLAELLRKIDDKRSRFSAFKEKSEVDKALAEEKVNTILNFAVPNSKGDLLEFLVTTETRSKCRLMDPSPVRMVAKAYARKLEECIAKAKVYFPNDSDFQRFFTEDDKPKKRFGLF